MPYKYIGRTTDFKGKTLWEILGNLKNLGVGRIIGRNMFQRYPEPSYIKVLKVEAEFNPKNPSNDNCRKVIVLCEKVFRGMKSDILCQIESSSYKTDHFLVPKHLEEKFCRPVEKKPMVIFPKKMELPPLVKEIVKRQMKSAGKIIKEEPKMTVMYNLSGIKNYRVAKDDETPNKPELKLGFGQPVAPRLIENIKSC